MLENTKLMLLEDFPKLYGEYLRRIDENYCFALMSMYTDTELGFDTVHIRMKRNNNNVTLVSTKGRLLKEELSIYEDEKINSASSQGLKLNSAAIFDKTFKKSIIGGYKEEEVDSFLDTIIEDYRIFERHIFSR